MSERRGIGHGCGMNARWITPCPASATARGNPEREATSRAG